MSRAAAALAAVIVCGVSMCVVAGCASTEADNGSAASTPSGPFKATDASVASAVKEAIDGAGSSPGIAGAPRVKCVQQDAAESMSGHPGTNCNVVYTVKEPAGIDDDQELIVPTAGFWKVLFSDPRFQGAYVEVKGPTTNTGGQSSTTAMFSISCDRNAAEHIDWSKIEGAGLRKLCTYVPLVGGLPPSESSG